MGTANAPNDKRSNRIAHYKVVMSVEGGSVGDRIKQDSFTVRFWA